MGDVALMWKLMVAARSPERMRRRAEGIAEAFRLWGAAVPLRDSHWHRCRRGRWWWK